MKLIGLCSFLAALAGAQGAMGQDKWSATPFLEFGDLGSKTNAVSLEVLGSTTNPDNSGFATDADVDVVGVSVAAAFQPQENFRFVLRLGAHGTDVEYNRFPRESSIDGFGIGADFYHLAGPAIFQIGASYSVTDTVNRQGPRFDVRDSWDSQVFEVHGSVVVEVFSDPVNKLSVFGGAQFLSLEQDAHTIGSQVIPFERRESQALTGGLEYRNTGPFGEIWVLGAIVHDFADRPPQRPTWIASGSSLANSFTLFSRVDNNIPAAYPNHTTYVLGIGLNAETFAGAQINAGFFREINNDFDANVFRAGLVFPF